MEEEEEEVKMHDCASNDSLTLTVLLSNLLKFRLQIIISEFLIYNLLQILLKSLIKNYW